MDFEDKKINKIYNMIINHYLKFLKKYGVVLPRLKISGQYTKDALVLIYLAQGYPQTRPVSKEELTQFIRKYYPNVNDVQQARHLGMQKGWYIISGTRGNHINGKYNSRERNSNLKLQHGEYLLVTLEKPHPAFRGHRKQGLALDDFEELKRAYGNRCATCGSKEGEDSYNYPGVRVTLMMAHMDPRKPLEKGNIIPQCQLCNRAYRNWWIFDNRGRIISIADPQVVKRFDEDIQSQIFKLLYEKYKKRIDD